VNVKVNVEGGGTATVRSVVSGAEPANDFATPADGEWLIRVDVEQCAGSESLSVNPLFWLLTGADNTTTGAFLGGQTLPTIEVAPAQCAAGTVEFTLPANLAPAYAILVNPLFEEVARIKLT